jgi:thermitase
MSLGDTDYSSSVQAGVDYAWSLGAVLVASAGNNGNSLLTYPASLPHVISVASTDANDVRASTSTYGSWVNLAAPGVNVFSTAPDSSNVIWGSGVKYATLSGTSMSSAVVSGIAGLVWATGHCGSGSTANACVRDKVQAGVDAIPGTGTDWMYGRVNAYKAVTG